MQLRDYQLECLNKIESMPKGAYLISMATGLGKTVVFSHIKRRGRVLVISHREELVYQPIKYYDCECGIEKAEQTSHGEQVVLASVQTLIKRLNKFLNRKTKVIEYEKKCCKGEYNEEKF